MLDIVQTQIEADISFFALKSAIGSGSAVGSPIDSFSFLLYVFWVPVKLYLGFCINTFICLIERFTLIILLNLPRYAPKVISSQSRLFKGQYSETQKPLKELMNLIMGGRDQHSQADQPPHA